MRGGAFFNGKEGRDDFRKTALRAVTSFPFREGFLSPVRGTEGVLKTIEGRFSKKPSLMGKSNANECNERSLSNCRVQLALSTKKDGMILEKD